MCLCLCLLLVQCLGERLKGECREFLASPGHGLQCKVVGVGVAGKEGGGEGEGEGGGRVVHCPCVVTEASLMNKPVTGDGELKVSILYHTHTQSNVIFVCRY